MSLRFTAVENSLRRVERRWKWLRFLQYSFALGIVLSLLLLFLGAAMLAGWLVSKPLAAGLALLVGAGGFVAWMVIVIRVAAEAPERPWMAAALERVDGRLQDRLHTLVFLERQTASHADSFARRIARQIQGVLRQEPPGAPFPATRVLKYSVAFVVALSAAVLLFQLYSPWSLLAGGGKTHPLTPTGRENPPSLALFPTNSVEQDQPWGEVRITEPGTDLRVTKVDVVPLQIEAAANHALKGVKWLSSVNGTGEVSHELPPPSEPRCAVYQPTLYLDELRLSDWDVLTYYASASTEKRNSYASEVYFIEVRPFREDILKLPGGEGGKPYQSLNEISTLISRQQHVIRETHQHLQNPPAQEAVRAQDRKKLSEAEGDLGNAAQHLYAKLATEMENKPIGEALDNLAKAEKSLGQASQTLRDNAINEAPNHERRALSELVAARKMFQKAVSDNPDAFQEPKEDEATPGKDSGRELSEMTEFRNESKAARDFVRKALEEQKGLEQQANSAAHMDYSRLSRQEKQLQQSLAQFQQQHPKAFQQAGPQSEQAREAMGKAADELQKRSGDAQNATRQATGRMQKLSDTLDEQAAAQHLADAYRLKRMLDEQAGAFDKRSKPGSQVSDQKLKETIDAARQTLEQFKKNVEQEAARGTFGQPLRDALNESNRADLESKLSRLQQAQSEAEKQQRAGEARDGLGKVSKAFAESGPKSLQQAQQKDALKPGEQDSFGQGMVELDSLIRQMQDHRQLPPEQQKKQGRQALNDLQTGLRGLPADDNRSKELQQKLQQMLQSETPFELAELKKLMEQLQRFSVESAERLARKEDQPQLSNIDPARLPPAYRGRIQKYFQKLSEK